MTQTRIKRVPFNLELAKKITKKEVKGRIVTRDGLQARIICFDKEGDYPIVALVKKSCGVENTYTYNKEGREFDNGMSLLDLFLEVPTYYKDYSNFEPRKYQPCLVRNGEDSLWGIQVYAYTDYQGKMLFYDGEGYVRHFTDALPLSKATKHLLGTTKSYEAVIKYLDAESTKKTNNNEHSSNFGKMPGRDETL